MERFNDTPHLPQSGLTHLTGGNPSVSRPAEARRGSHEEGPCPHGGVMRSALCEARDSALAGTVQPPAVTANMRGVPTTTYRGYSRFTWTSEIGLRGGASRPQVHRRRRLMCYGCNVYFAVSLLSRLHADWSNNEKRECAVRLRVARRLGPRQVEEDSRVCLNCRHIQMTSVHHGEALLNVLLQSRRSSCMICDQPREVVRVPFSARIDAFLAKNIYIPNGTRICEQHLEHNSQRIQRALMAGLLHIRRRIAISGGAAGRWMEALQTQVIRQIPDRFTTVDNFSDEEFYALTGLQKAQFQGLLLTCANVRIYNTNRNVHFRDLLLFLCKMRHGLSDSFVSVMFSFQRRSTVSLTVTKVRQSLMQNFVPRNLGLAAITREEYIQQHVPAFANRLYNPEQGDPKAILIIDGGYIRIPKSSNHRVLRQSFCVHKGYHLVKPVLVVAPNGYILDVHGPYFSDSRNNDANILRNELENNINGLRQWVQDGDIFVVDRGYRDALNLLRQLGMRRKIPGFALQGRRRQGTWEEANASRLVTKCRWVVEARFRHLKSWFKIFKDMIAVAHVPHVGDFFRIGCALMNAYRPDIRMQGYDEQRGQEMLERSTQPNRLQQRVETERLDLQRSAVWVQMDQNHLPEFPVIPLDYLRDITWGSYQVKLSPGYVQDKFNRDQQYRYEISLFEPGLLKARMYLKHSQAVRYMQYIQYTPRSLEVLRGENPPQRPEPDPILGWYCTCKVGARTLEMCAHLASIIWYMGYARHTEEAHYPQQSLLHQIQDAGNRELPELIEPRVHLQLPE